MSTLLSFTALAAAARQPKLSLPSKAALKRTALGLALVAALGFAGERGYDYWKVGRFQVSTDNAYVQADYTTVAPKISGYVTEVLVGDNQSVKAGDVLIRLDARDYRANLAKAEGAVAAEEPPTGHPPCVEDRQRLGHRVQCGEVASHRRYARVPYPSPRALRRHPAAEGPARGDAAAQTPRRAAARIG